jgi:lysophospholipase L1-like esterase
MSTEAPPKAEIRGDFAAYGARKRRLLRPILKLTTPCVAFLVGLLLAELIVRIFIPQNPSWLDVFVKTDSPVYGLQPDISRTISTGESTWSIYTDASGFRCGKGAATTGRPLILVLGDSFTFGMGVDYEQSIPGCIAAALADKFDIINTGVPGYGPTQYRQVLQNQLDKHARLAGVVLITFLANDFHDCITSKGNVRDGVLGNEQTLRSAVKRHSHLYRFAASAYHQLPAKKLEHRAHEWELYHTDQWIAGPLEEALTIYRSEMTHIAELCAAHDIPLLACIIPSPRAVQIADGTHQPDAGEQFDLPARYASSVFAAAAVATIDVTPILAATGQAHTYFAWDEHLNPTGNKLTANAILAAWEALPHAR